jgi:hypothetical protein
VYSSSRVRALKAYHSKVRITTGICITLLAYYHGSKLSAGQEAASGPYTVQFSAKGGFASARNMADRSAKETADRSAKETADRSGGDARLLYGGLVKPTTNPS